MQMTIFDISGEGNGKTIGSDYIFNIGDTVEVRKIREEDTSMSAEDYFYLKEYQERRGRIVKRHRCSNGHNSYEVEYERVQNGIFYESDLLIL